MIDLEKERKDFEKTSCPDFNKVTFEITSRYKQGHYKEKSSHHEDLDESQTLSMSWFSWLNRAEIAQQTIESLKAQLAQYQSDDYVLVKKDNKTVVAIENMVEQQVEASGIDEPIHRLDGWLIIEAMIEAQEQHNAKP